MPLTAKGEEIKQAMTQQYGAKKGEQVFYASKNAGTISGVDAICDAFPIGGALNGMAPENDPFALNVPPHVGQT